MYGYVRPEKGELKVKEYEQYRAMYCGLCHALKKRCGFGARMFLSYDLCFLAMLLSGARQEPIALCAKRCPVSPLRRRSCCACTPALETAADLTMILAYEKARDGVRDEKGFKKLAAWVTKALLASKYKKSAARCPEFAGACREGIENLCALEKERTESLDRPAEAFAQSLSAAAVCFPESQKRQAQLLLYHIGRWIYIADAWDDVEEDLKTGNYNAVILRWDLKTAAGRLEHADELMDTLALSASTAASAAELMELGPWRSIIENTLYLGLPAMARAVQSGRKKQRRTGHGSL